MTETNRKENVAAVDDDASKQSTQNLELRKTARKPSSRMQATGNSVCVSDGGGIARFQSSAVLMLLIAIAFMTIVGVSMTSCASSTGSTESGEGANTSETNTLSTGKTSDAEGSESYSANQATSIDPSKIKILEWGDTFQGTQTKSSAEILVDSGTIEKLGVAKGDTLIVVFIQNDKFFAKKYNEAINPDYAMLVDELGAYPDNPDRERIAGQLLDEDEAIELAQLKGLEIAQDKMDDITPVDVANNDVVEIRITGKGVNAYGDPGYRLYVKNKSDKDIDVDAYNLKVNGIKACQVVSSNTNVGASEEKTMPLCFEPEDSEESSESENAIISITILDDDRAKFSEVNKVEGEINVRDRETYKIIESYPLKI